MLSNVGILTGDTGEPQINSTHNIDVRYEFF